MTSCSGAADVVGRAPAGQRHRAVALEPQDHRPVVVAHDAVEAAPSPAGARRRRPPAARPPVAPSSRSRVDVQRAGRGGPSVPASHSPAVWKHSSTSRGRAAVGRSPARGRPAGPSANRAAAPSPCRQARGDHLVGRAVEVQPVDVLRRSASGRRSARLTASSASRVAARCVRQPHRAGEVDRPLRSVGCPAACARPPAGTRRPGRRRRGAAAR